MSEKYTVGDFWLSKRKGRDTWYITWYDSNARQTRFKTCGTEDIRQAKVIINDHFIQNQDISGQDDSILLDVLLLRYWHKHGSTRPSSDVIQYSLNHWSTFFSEKPLSAINPQSIDDFIDHLQQSQGLANGSINRILSDGRAAINRAHKYGEIKSAPFIKSLPKGESFKFRPSVEMIGRFFDAMVSDQLFKYTIIRLCTACRDDAAMDLTKSQVDFHAKLVDLNPAGRQQTKKHRPIVPLSPTLEWWLDQWDEPLIQYRGRKVKSVRQAWRKTRIRAGLPAEFIRKVLRHSVATEIRRCGVPQWELSGFLGHRTGTTTDDYAIYDPNYLSGCVEAIEGFLVQIQRHTSKVIIPSKQDRVRLIK